MLSPVVSKTSNACGHFFKVTRNECKGMHVVTFSKKQGMHVVTFSKRQGMHIVIRCHILKDSMLSTVVTFSRRHECMLSHSQDKECMLSSVIRVGNSLIGFLYESLDFERKRAKVQFALFKVWITVLALFNWSTRENHTCLSFLMSAGSKCYISLIAIRSFVLGIKRGKAWWKEQFWSESLLCKKCDSLLCKKSESLLKERITLS